MRPRRRSSFGRNLRRLLLFLLIVGGTGYLGYQWFNYHQTRDTYPMGMTVGGVDVYGLGIQETEERLRELYLSPVSVYHREQRVEVDPLEVGFNLDVPAMSAEAQEAYHNHNYWLGFFSYVSGWNLEPITIPLQGGYDPALLEEMLEVIAGYLDEPARPPQILSENATFEQGRPGFATDIEASLPMVEAALYRPHDRIAHLVIEDQEAPELSFELLEQVIAGKLATFDGLGSIFVMDLQTGDEIAINADVAQSGMSVLKIAIFLEALRFVELPLNDYERQLFVDTATQSSNFAANLLLHVIAGENNTYRGADLFTESMRNLGLDNTFMAVPYDAVPPPQRRTTYETPANRRADIDPAYIDPTRQTTAAELGTVLEMLYHCSKGGGALMMIYPGEITPEECQLVIELMTLNVEGNLIRFGVPDDVPVSHKHGWIENTHADAGIVLSPGGDYVIVEYLHQDTDWLQADISFPILREISRAVYNYFNFENPYVGDALVEEDRFEDDGGVESPETEPAGPEAGGEPVDAELDGQ